MISATCRGPGRDWVVSVEEVFELIITRQRQIETDHLARPSGSTVERLSITLVHPKLVAAAKADPLLDHDSRVGVLATALILEEGGPLAEMLIGLPEPTEDDDPLNWDDTLEQQRAFLRATLAWTAVENALAETNA